MKNGPQLVQVHLFGSYQVSSVAINGRGAAVSSTHTDPRPPAKAFQNFMMREKYSRFIEALLTKRLANFLSVMDLGHYFLAGH